MHIKKILENYELNVKFGYNFLLFFEKKTLKSP